MFVVNLIMMIELDQKLIPFRSHNTYTLFLVLIAGHLHSTILRISLVPIPRLLRRTSENGSS